MDFDACILYSTLANKGYRTRTVCDLRTKCAQSYVCFPRFFDVGSARAPCKNESSGAGIRGAADTESYSGGTVVGHKMHVT